jgi:hypothetical protein
VAHAAASPSLSVVPTDLAALHAEYFVHQALRAGESFQSSNSLLSIVADDVVIDAVASGSADALKSDLQALGLQDAVTVGRVVSGRLPIAAIGALPGVASLSFARPALATTSAGTVTSQGDRAMRADVARSAFGVSGAGVKVGVLSDSFNCLGGAAADVASGDLSPVAVLQEMPGCGGATDEGRAMLQIVHDVAPGASLSFATAFTGQAGFANNILNLAAAGAGVIVDDVIYFAEPMFQDGIVAQAVDIVVASGVSYFSSAGNQGRAAYQSAFVNSGINLGSTGTNQIHVVPTFLAHDFDPGPGVDVFQTVTFPTGSTSISFQWNDPFASVSGPPGAQTNLDIAVLDMAGNFLFGRFDLNVGADPVEILAVSNSGAPAQAQLAIGKVAGPDPSVMKYVALRSTFVVNQYATGSGTIYGHANALGAEAVGAAAAFDTPELGVSPPVLESFSSRGTTPILRTLSGAPTFDARTHKPGIVAPDGGNTTFFGADTTRDPDTLPNFFGTSAAAPHAAAVAALLLQAVPGLAPAEVYAALEDTAIDMAAPGFDNDTGSGLIQADAALAPFLGEVPTVTIAATAPNASEAGPSPGAFTVTRAGSTVTSITVSYAVAGTAKAGTDYTALAGSVVIPAGAASASVLVSPIDDAVIGEGNETVVLTLTGGAGYVVGSPASATVTIADNDRPAVTIRATDPTATEAGLTRGTFTVTRTGIATGALTVLYTVGGSASGGGDHAALPGSVVIPVGAFTASITVTPVDDALVEAAETVIVTLSSDLAYVVGSPGAATVTITDNDRPTVTIRASDTTATEASRTTGTFIVTRTATTPPVALTVRYTVAGSASASDYDALSGSVVIPAGARTATIPVRPTDDAFVEAAETVVVTLSPDPAYVVGAAKTATVTIADNDRPTVTLRATDTTATEAGLTTGAFTVTRTATTPSVALTVRYTVAGSALPGGDYTALTGSVIIPAGSNTAVVTVTPRDDAIVEAGETVIVTLSADAAYLLGTPRTATVTITSND